MAPDGSGGELTGDRPAEGNPPRAGHPQADADMYADLCENARAQAYARLVEHAQGMGADAVIAMRFTSTSVGESAAEILAYGTAVKLQ